MSDGDDSKIASFESTNPSRQLIDSFGRVHNNLRISVTDRCNIRCFYCMPEDNVQFMSRSKLLSFEEIERVVRIGVSLGINKLRLTGGEPLVRKDLSVLVSKLSVIDGIKDIGLTTNGVLLAEQAQQLRDSGLKRLNISLDALDPEVFRKVTRRDGYDKVIAGIEAAREAGFDPIKINAVSIRNLTEDQLIPFAELARSTNTEVRFIEFMPLDADGNWNNDQVLPASEIIEKLASHYGPLTRTNSAADRSPSSDYTFADGVGKIGVIPSVTAPFCASCNRFRMTADGKLRNCLFSLEETDVRELLRSDGTDQAIGDAMIQCVATKKAGHQINSPDFVQPDRPMYSIGG